MKETYIQLGEKQLPFFVHDRVFTQHGTLEDFISETIAFTHDFYEKDFLEHIAKKGFVSKSFLDIGANIGNHSVFVHEVMGIKNITVVEPYPLNVSVLEGNCPWARIERVALGDKETEMKATISLVKDTRPGAGLFMGNAGGTFLEEGTGTKVVTLDSLKLESCDLVKIDVEGMEVEVVKGAIETFTHFKPIIWIEINYIQNVGPVLESLPPGYVLTDTFNPGNPMFCFEHHGKL